MLSTLQIRDKTIYWAILLFWRLGLELARLLSSESGHCLGLDLQQGSGIVFCTVIVILYFTLL